MSNTSLDSVPRENLGLRRIQRRRKFFLLLAALTAAALLPFVHSMGGETFVHEGLEMLGIAAIALAVIGRSWCTLYIGGRKSHEIVATGPYSVSRNPLYVFSFIGIAGIAAQTGSATVVVVLTGISVAIFLPAILNEEKALAGRFGADYARYLARVPRFGPKFSAWVDMEKIEVTPRLFWRTAREGLLFFLVLPVCEGVEWLQDAGYLVPLFYLP